MDTPVRFAGLELAQFRGLLGPGDFARCVSEDLLRMLGYGNAFVWDLLSGTLGARRKISVGKVAADRSAWVSNSPYTDRNIPRVYRHKLIFVSRTPSERLRKHRI